MGVHESQSLLWERMVGLSRPFAAYLLPLMRQYFPQASPVPHPPCRARRTPPASTPVP